MLFRASIKGNVMKKKIELIGFMIFY